jgi:polar amino acid transport system substrate-binding protein
MSPMRRSSARTTRTAAGLLALAGLAVTACGGSGSTSSHRYGLIQNGVITAATVSDNAPFSSPGADGRPQGMLIDLDSLIAKRLGVKVVYKETTVPAALAGLTSGQYDMAAVSLTESPDRAANVAFSTPLTWGQNIVMVRSGAGSTAHTTADLQGRRIGVVSGSSQADYASRSLTHSTVVNVADDSTGLTQLIDGSLDGYVMGLSQATVALQQHPGKLRIATTALQPTPAGVGFRKTDTALHDAYQRELARLVADGTFLKLYDRYFPGIAYRPEMLKYWPQLKTQLAAANGKG